MYKASENVDYLSRKKSKKIAKLWKVEIWIVIIEIMVVSKEIKYYKSRNVFYCEMLHLYDTIYNGRYTVENKYNGH